MRRAERERILVAGVRRTLRSPALRALGARLLAREAPEYPAGLRDLADAPPFLVVRGPLRAGGIALVGTRTPSPEAERFAFALAAALGVPIVSGLARGIDAAAHRGALAAGVPTLAYVATGIDRTFPPEHAALAEEILAGGGALATERPPGAAASRWGLLRRDRLQAAHTVATVLVATEPSGGALHTLRFARLLGRPRFALAPRPDVNGAGNALAVAEGAVVLPWDVTEAAAALAQVPAVRGAIVGER